MQVTPERSDRLVCAVLAAQVAAIRDRMDTGATVDLLWRTVDLMSELASLVVEMSRDAPAGDPEQNNRRSSALAAETEIARSLENIACLQTQHYDATRQMADCIVIILKRMAAVTAAADPRPSPDELAALYVSEEQRQVHEAVARQFGTDAAGEASVEASVEAPGAGTGRATPKGAGA